MKAYLSRGKKFIGDSIVLEFPYNKEIIDYIKSFPVRYYDNKSKTWEIPLEYFPRFIDFYKNPITLYIYIKSEEEKKEIEIPEDYNFPFNPYPHQLEGIKFGLNHNNFLLADGMGMGKALALDTNLLTPIGWRNIKDINVNDLLIGRDGNPTRVLNIYNHINKHIYKVSFSDGTSVKCCDEHLWTVQTSHDRSVGKYQLLQLKDILKKYRTKHKYKYYIPMVEPIEFVNNKLPIHPYILGCLIGDGGLHHGCYLSNSDSYIINKVRSFLEPGYELNQISKYDYRIRKTNDNKCYKNYYKDHIRLLGLNVTSHYKFIPNLYKYTSSTNRLLLLQGLMDTDGYIHKTGCMQFTTVSEKLCQDFIELIQSLGGVAIKRRGLIKNKFSYYTITFKLKSGIIPVSLPRKVNRVRKIRKYEPIRMITNIEYIGDFPCKCLTVDAKDGLFVIDNYIVTHNTVQSATVACIKKKLYGYKHCLILCAVNGSKYNWKKECELFTNEKAHILGTRVTKKGNEVIKSSVEKIEDIQNIDTLPYFIITNKETLRNKEIIKELERQSEKIDMCIYDEIHMNSNIQSQQGKGLLKIDCDCKIALSGTPILNNPLDTYMVMRWLGYENHSLTAYKQRYCVMGGYGGHEIISYKNMEELRSRFRKVQLRRLKENCLDLPPKLHETEYLELSDKQKILYNEVKNDIISNIDNKNLSPNPLVRIIRLRQVTGNPAILSDKLQDSVKYDRCEQIISDLTKENRKCLVFSNWVEVILPLYERLKKYNPALIIGETKNRIEQEKLKLNTDPNCHCCLGTIGAMGTSHTLTGADTVIFLDEPWNRGVKEQCEDRIYRIGTKNSVNIITFICKNTIDERINQIIQEKGEWADCIVDGKIIKKSDEILNFLLS